MLNKVFEYGKQLVSVVQKQQKHEEDIKEIRREMREIRQDIVSLRDETRDLARAVEILNFTIQRDYERREAQNKVLLLEIENRFLRLQQGLPPAPSSDKPE